MSTTVRRLEQVLQAWEDFCYLGALHLRTIAVTEYRRTWKQSASAMTGPEKHWREFRRFLLSFRDGDAFDLHRFVDSAMWKDLNTSIYASVPSMLAAWTAHSRHVFHVSPELQQMLELTSVSRLRWKDVPWPYDAFAITLDQPIVADDGVVFDCILVSRKVYVQERGTYPFDLAFYVLPQALDQHSRVDWRHRSRFDRLAALGHITQLRTEVEAYQNQFAPLRDVGKKMNIAYGGIALNPDDEIVDILDNMRQDDGSSPGLVQCLDLALRVVVSLCAYLSTLPPQSGSVVEVVGAPADPEVRGIISGAHVCTVLSSYTLSTEERRLLGPTEGMRQVRQHSPHWRRGHFRREPGQGHNPHAPRCVWVRPTLVRKDLLKPGLQVGGAEVEVE